MKKDTVEITLTNGATNKISGYAVNFDFLPNYNFVVHIHDIGFYTDYPRWTVTEKTTGSRIELKGVESFKRKEAIDNAKAQLQLVTSDQFDWLIERQLAKINDLKNTFNIKPQE